MSKDKYRYTGPDNNKCPVCGSKKDIAPPVIYLVGDKKIGQHKWCTVCFNLVQRIMGRCRTEKQIEMMLPGLTNQALAALGSHNVPNDHVVKGFHLMNVPKQGLTLVMEFQHE